MTINEFAKKHGITRQAVYQRLKACKVDLDSVRNKQTQGLYPEGEDLLVKLFDSEKTELNAVNESKGLQLDDLVKLKDQALMELEEARKRIQELEMQVKTTEDQAQALKQAAEVLAAKLEIVPELRKQIESLENDKAFLQSQIPPRLTDGTERKGFFRRLFGNGSR